MKTLTAAGGLALIALAFPSSALAHDAAATVSCSGATFDFVKFTAGSNTVSYKVSVDGIPTLQGRFRLDATGGRAGRLAFPLALNDSHRITASAWWGPADVQDRHVRPSGSPALADRVVNCPATPPPAPTPVLTPVPPPTPVPAPVPEPTPVPVPPASGGVLGVTAISPVTSKSAQANATCVSTPRSLSIRARELTTIRVRIKADGTSRAGAVVRITGPGFVRKLTTDAEGMATFKVRPSRSGTLVVQSDRCLGADRLAVRSARRVASRQLPRVTG